MRYECHAHIVLDGYDYHVAIDRHKPGPDEAWVRSVLREYQAAGIGYVRDGGDHQGVSLLAADIAPEYGICYRTPAFAIHKKKRYGAMVGRAYEDIAEYRTLVAEVKKLGGDFIKIMFTGILDFNEYGKITSQSLDEEEMREVTDIAHGEGFAVMVHCNGADAVKIAVAAGVDSIEHGFYMDEEAMSALASSDTVWVPTIAPVGNQIGSKRFPDDVLSRIVEEQTANLKRVFSLGGIVAPGSDAGAFAVPHVKGTLDEYGYMEKAVPESALREGEAMIEQRFKRK